MAEDHADDSNQPPGGPMDPDRRRFLGYAWKGLAAALVIEAGWTTYDILNPRRSAAFGGVINAGTVNDYPAGAARYFLNGRCWVTSSEGGLVALYQKCPHLGCKVPFNAATCRFECPCHGSKYNIRGEYLEGPAPRGLDRFPIKIQGDQVLVDTGSVVEGPAKGQTSLKGSTASPCAGSGASP